DKQENGTPISPAKLGQRVVRLLFFAAVGGGKDEAPAGSYKLTRFASTLASRLAVHERTFLQSEKRRNTASLSLTDYCHAERSRQPRRSFSEGGRHLTIFLGAHK